MRDYTIRRVLLIIPTLLIVSILIFFALRLMQGDAVNVMASLEQRGGQLSPETLRRIRQQLGLTRPIHVQYADYLWNAVRGNLGNSLFNKRSVWDMLRERMPVTLEIVVLSMIFLSVWGIAVGVVSAFFQDRWIDYLLRTIAILGLSIPFFWLSVLVILYGSFWLNYSPPLLYISFFDNPLKNLGQYVPPVIILAFALGATVARMTRATVLEVLRQDYIRTAYAKGLPERLVISRHAMRNALIPVVSLIGLEVAFAFSGSIVLEAIWGFPGMGRLLLDVMTKRDFPVLEGIILFTVSIVLVINIVVDLSYAWLNPRIRYE